MALCHHDTGSDFDAGGCRNVREPMERFCPEHLSEFLSERGRDAYDTAKADTASRDDRLTAPAEVHAARDADDAPSIIIAGVVVPASVVNGAVVIVAEYDETTDHSPLALRNGIIPMTFTAPGEGSVWHG